MPIPSKETIVKRIVKAENYIIEACEYLPCHSDLETCNLCFCIFYPCEDADLGEFVTSGKGTEVWSCMDCNWAHRKDTVERLRKFLRNESNRTLAPKEMYQAFRRELEKMEK